MNLATERIISHLNELHDVTKFYKQQEYQWD